MCSDLIFHFGIFCSLNWQHQLCKNPRPNPDIKTLFTDHTCTPPNGAVAPAPVNLPVAAVAKPAAFTSLGAHGVRFFVFSLVMIILVLTYSLLNDTVARLARFNHVLKFVACSPFHPQQQQLQMPML